MLTASVLSKKILNEWDKTTNIFIIAVTNSSKILEYNTNFEVHTKKIKNLDELITYTHRSNFTKSLSFCIKNKTTINFTTNFSFNPKDVEDIPYTYKIVLEYIEENHIMVIAEPIPPLSHNDARAYFSMINDYSSLSRKLEKTNFNIIKKNNELKEAIKKIEFYANYDSLTKIFNRRRILEEINKEFNRYKRLNHTFCISMIDIDDFKKVNDKHGHINGDIVLKAFTNEIMKSLRTYDSIGRFGGEEFIILFPSSTIYEAKKILKRILEIINEKKIKLLDNNYITVTFSAGVEEIKEEMTINELLLEVDKKLYAAKDNGKNLIK